MKSFRCEALTLRTYPYSESNRIAVFLTRPFGIVRGVAYGARKMPSRFGSSLEPMTHVKLSFSRKEHQELAIVQHCEILRSFSLQELDWDTNLHFGYFAELLSEFGREEIESERLFRLTLATLNAVDQVPIRVLARYFELWILKLEGVLPPLETKFSEMLARKLIQMLKLPPAELSSIAWSEGELALLGRVNGELIEYHLEKSLKSRKMLNELL